MVRTKAFNKKIDFQKQSLHYYYSITFIRVESNTVPIFSSVLREIVGQQNRGMATSLH